MKKTPQRYYVPELDKEIKVETITNKVKVAHFPDGAERVTTQEIKIGKWEHRGIWVEKEL